MTIVQTLYSSEHCVQAIANTAANIVQHAVSEAMESPELPPEDLFTHVYSESN